MGRQVDGAILHGRKANFRNAGSHSPFSDADSSAIGDSRRRVAAKESGIEPPQSKTSAGMAVVRNAG